MYYGVIENQKYKGSHMSFRTILSKIWNNVQLDLFPQMEEDVGALSETHKHLISVLELIRVEEFVPCTLFNEGRPCRDRRAMARAFIAKIIFKFSYTKQLVAYLKTDKQLRIICGWDSNKIPSTSKFSRVFQEFANIALPERVHQALIKGIYKDQIVGHVVKDLAP